jgi:hypothetical protein
MILYIVLILYNFKQIQFQEGYYNLTKLKVI